MKNRNYIKIFSWISISIVTSISILVLSFICFGMIRTFDLNLIFDFGEIGVIPKIITTVFITFISLSCGLFIGLITSVYLEEYLKNKTLKKWFKIILSTLNAIPSVIFGLFGYSFFVLILNLPVSTFVGGLTLGIMILPTIIFISSNALANIDSNLKVAAYALGGKKLKIISQILLNEARNGILNAIVLSLAKILGESAALVLTMGTVYDFTLNVFDSSKTLSLHMLTAIKSDVLSPHQISQTMFLSGFIVLSLSLILILISQKISKRG